jgi:signal transduction histidine kinase
VFALATMALATGVVVFSNVASILSISVEFSQTGSGFGDEESWGSDGVGVSAPSRGATEGRSTPASIGDAARSPDVAIISQQQWQWSAIGVGGAGVVAGLIGWELSRRMLRPIDRITRTANRISASNLHERIAMDGPDDELRRLSTTIDGLLDRFETAYESQRRFVAQASHELRTPLAVERAALQIGLARDSTADEIEATKTQLLDHNRRTEHLVESLLVLAEADRGLGTSECVDLSTIAEEVTASRFGVAADAGVELQCLAGSQGITTSAVGEPVLVRAMLANLVDNAIEYNEAGGFVHVRLTATSIEIENSGRSLEGVDVADLLEPFRRGDERGSRPHSGLGLSIVASIVRAHGWRLTVEPRPSGGLRVVIAVSSV